MVPSAAPLWFDVPTIHAVGNDADRIPQRKIRVKKLFASALTASLALVGAGIAVAAPAAAETVVSPQPVERVTACGATPADVPVPADTDAITYTMEEGGIRAVANPGYVFDWQGIFDAGYYPESETEALLSLRQVLSPSCELTEFSFAAVCDAGEAWFEYDVTPPAGAVEDGFTITFEGPGGGYEVLYGDAGFGHPFSGRLPWRDFMTNDDGTISGWDSSLRVTDVYVAFGISVPMGSGAGQYSVWYSNPHSAQSELVDVSNPCGADDGGTTDDGQRGNALGRDHEGHPARPTRPEHPVTPVRAGHGA